MPSDWPSAPGSPLDGERGDQQNATSASGCGDLSNARCRRRIGIGRLGPSTLTIGPISQSTRISAGRCFGIGLQELECRTDVARETMCTGALPAGGRYHLDLDRGGAEQPAGVPATRTHAGHRLESLPEPMAADCSSPLRLGDTIDRFDERPGRRRASRAFSRRTSHFCTWPEVRQHDGTEEIDSGFGGM